jgi:Ca2+-binding RTX toxin-like protein
MATWVGTPGEDEFHLATGDSYSEMYGDGSGGSGGISGNDDTLSITVTGPDGQGRIYGDYRVLYDVGGNDVLNGGDGSFFIVIFGDAHEMFGSSAGGDDHIVGGSSEHSLLSGDANLLYNSSLGGNDTIEATSLAHSFVHGDAQGMYEDSVGGNDLLIGGAHSSHLFGDALHLLEQSRGGNDRLVSGSGNEEMWGDGRLNGNAVGGADVFAFTPGNGQDQVMDFRHGEDRIELRDFWVVRETVNNTFKGSAKAWDNLPEHVQAKFLEAGPPLIRKIGFGDLTIDVADGSSVIRFEDGGTITVAGVTDLTAADFLFV